MHTEKKKEPTENKEYFKRLQSGFHLEADRMMSKTSVCVSNVTAIIDFRSEFAVLKMKKGRIKIIGENLSISIYENKIVEISGKVGNIEFL